LKKISEKGTTQRNSGRLPLTQILKKGGTKGKANGLWCRTTERGLQGSTIDFLQVKRQHPYLQFRTGAWGKKNTKNPFVRAGDGQGKVSCTIKTKDITCFGSNMRNTRNAC